ncbi:MAG: energy-coupling factor transporter transmembrane component T family protein [Candidatus Thorarchaeota archaeon]
MASDQFVLPFREKPLKKPISNIGLSLITLITLIFLLVNPFLEGDIFYQKIVYISIIYSITLVLLLFFRGKFFKTLKVVVIAFIVIFFLGLSSFFLKQGELLIAIPIGKLTLNLYEIGVYRAIMIWMRGLFSVSIVVLYSTIVTLQEFIQALRSLFLPNILVTLILLILRYTPMLYSEGQEVHIAQKLRGLESAPFRRKFSATAARLGGTLIGSVRKGTQVYEGMVLRGLENSDLVKRSTTALLDWIILPFICCFYILLSGGFLAWIF